MYSSMRVEWKKRDEKGRKVMEVLKRYLQIEYPYMDFHAYLYMHVYMYMYVYIQLYTFSKGTCTCMVSARQTHVHE